MAKEEERKQGWGPWVGILLALGVGLYFYVTCASHSKQHEAEYQRVIHAYEEAIFHKKVDVYKQEFKQKEMQLREEVKERERLGEELKKANAQIEVANTELTKANKIIEDEAAAIAEWKTKVDMESKTVADLTNQLKDKQNETEYLVREVKMLSDYAKRKDSALGLVMGTLSKTEKAKSEAQAQADALATARTEGNGGEEAKEEGGEGGAEGEQQKSERRRRLRWTAAAAARGE